MFGLSLSKLLVLLIVCGAVWYGFKYLKLRERQLARDAERATADRAARPAPGGPAASQAAVAEDLSKCPVCATYVARGARGCGRSDCPQG
ncbi:MAG: hypothetical protein WDO24_03040 [Pseudomonadota bacterium]